MRIPLLIIFLLSSLLCFANSNINPHEDHEHIDNTGINKENDEIKNLIDNHEDHESNENGSHISKNSSGRVILSEKQKQLINLKISTVSSIEESKEILLYGEVHFDKTKLTKVMVKVPGFVKSIYKNIGDRVKKNAPLA
jgi:hypothetical protein